MKLSTARAQQAIDQMEEEAEFQQTVAIPDNNPIVPQLTNLFGEHTFFLNGVGLHIIEPDQSAGAAPECQVLRLATWDAGHSALTPQVPEHTGCVVLLKPENGG